MAENVWLALLFPLVGFLWCALFGRLSPRLAGWIATIAIGLSFVAAVSVLVGLNGRPADDRILTGNLYVWVISANVSVPMGVLVDPLATIMLLVVTGVSF